MRDESRAVVLSGCSGGGKSTVLEHLRRRGFPTVAEPGRRIVREQLRVGGHALPWTDPAGFAQRCLDLARADLLNCDHSQWVFFDRSLVDAASSLDHHTGSHGCTVDELRGYHRRVFLTPPWRELYAGDTERQLGFDEAVAEYERLQDAYAALGYGVTVLPRTDVDSRVDLILNQLGLA